MRIVFRLRCQFTHSDKMSFIILPSNKHMYDARQYGVMISRVVSPCTPSPGVLIFYCHCCKHGGATEEGNCSYLLLLSHRDKVMRETVRYAVWSFLDALQLIMKAYFTLYFTFQGLHFYILFEDIHLWAVLFSVFMMNYVLQDGKANYFQGE